VGYKKEARRTNNLDGACAHACGAHSRALERTISDKQELREEEKRIRMRSARHLIDRIWEGIEPVVDRLDEEFGLEAQITMPPHARRSISKRRGEAKCKFDFFRNAVRGFVCLFVVACYMLLDCPPVREPPPWIIDLIIKITEKNYVAGGGMQIKRPPRIGTEARR
jgi:hypothetical protein